MDHPDDRRALARWRERDSNSGIWMALGLGIAAGAIGYAAWEIERRNKVGHRPPDSAPQRTARQRRFGRYAVTGRTVTINKDRKALYDFWRDFKNLPLFMENVHEISIYGDITRWVVRAPMGREVTLVTRIVDDRPGEQIAWRSTEESEVETEGKVMFRDAPAGRGTQLEAIIAYVPPAGELGRMIAKLFQAEPAIQGRRELRRFKMLMEAGEIATNRNRKAA